MSNAKKKEYLKGVKVLLCSRSICAACCVPREQSSRLLLRLLGLGRAKGGGRRRRRGRGAVGASDDDERQVSVILHLRVLDWAQLETTTTGEWPKSKHTSAKHLQHKQ